MKYLMLIIIAFVACVNNPVTTNTGQFENQNKIIGSWQRVYESTTWSTTTTRTFNEDHTWSTQVEGEYPYTKKGHYATYFNSYYVKTVVDSPISLINGAVHLQEEWGKYKFYDDRFEITYYLYSPQIKTALGAHDGLIGTWRPSHEDNPLYTGSSYTYVYGTDGFIKEYKGDSLTGQKKYIDSTEYYICRTGVNYETVDTMYYNIFNDSLFLESNYDRKAPPHATYWKL